MAKTLSEAPITSPNARKALPAGLYWRRIDSDTHLGYRRGKRAGVWLVRWRDGRGYRQAPLGTADDTIKEGTLSFEKAEAAARKHVEAAKVEAKALADGPPLTVRLAVQHYFTMRDKRESGRIGRSVRSNASHRLGRHVLGAPAFGKRPATPAAPLADVLVHRLSENHLRAWVTALPSTLKPATIRRLVADLKAALNDVVDRNKERLPASLPAIIRGGLNLDDRDDADDGAEDVVRADQVLTDAQVGTLIRAAREVDTELNLGGDLLRLIVVMAATGARYSQVVRLRVADFQIAQSRLLMPRSRKGKKSKAANKSPFITIPIGRDVTSILVQAATGRAPAEPLLTRQRYRRLEGRRGWEPAGRGPWTISKELQTLWQPIRERAKMPGVIPYAFRHSSIVRGIRANLPLRLVADAHDTSTVMIEKHYSRWVTSGLEDMLAGAVVPLVPHEGGADIVVLRG